METQTKTDTLPAWLTSSVTMGEVTNIIFNNFFEEIIERVSNGEPLSQIVREDPRGFPVNKVRAWVMSDPERKHRYYEAKAIGAESVEDEMISIADGDGLEDVQRSTLRINTRKWLVGVWNRDRYAEKKSEGATVNININGLLQDRESQLSVIDSIGHRVIIDAE
jgi:hypothetical protein